MSLKQLGRGVFFGGLMVGLAGGLRGLGQEPPAAPVPQAQAPVAGPPAFAKPDPANFTAEKPTAEDVNGFLKATWGYDPDRAWQVEAITKTSAAGVSKVVVAVAQKSNPSQIQSLVFFSLPDGKHIVPGNELIDFGTHPFEENRKVLQAEASGPARGAKSKDLLLVEFSDFQCPHCKDAQPTVHQVVEAFPGARFVYENFPLPQHTEAPKAAAYGVCVQKLGGDEAFFKYADAIFDRQAGLTPEASDETLKDVVGKLGLDAGKIAVCSASAETLAAVKASVDLAQKLEVHETPTLFVNGRPLPLGGIPFDQLKSIISYQAAEDGVAGAAAPAK